MKAKAIKDNATGLFLGSGKTGDTKLQWVESIDNAWFSKY